MPSLREKVEGPAAIREVVEAARKICDSAHVPAEYVPCIDYGPRISRGDCTHTRCLVVLLRRKLERLDEIRTGGEKTRECPDCSAHGWIMVPNAAGEPEQFQCQRCHGDGFLSAREDGAT